MNIMIKLQYDGTDFCGSQKQTDVRTVQGDIEKGLSELYRKNIKTIFSGRTDSGVHAKQQVLNFNTENSSIPPEKIIHPLNAILPDDILALSSRQVPDDFNSRFDAKKRTYKYFTRTGYNIFRKKYSCLINKDLDIDELNKFSAFFKGRKDFTSFCSSKTEVSNHICNISELYFYKDDDEFVMHISADRFLHNMVRIIMSLFVEINRGSIHPDNIRTILEKRDRSFSPKTFPPHGLFLWKVEY